MGQWYGKQSGYLNWSYIANVYPDSITTRQNSIISYEYNNRYQLSGYLWRPWVSRFSIGINSSATITNFHDSTKSEGNIRPEISTILTLFPVSNFDGTISATVSPRLLINKTPMLHSNATRVKYEQHFIPRDKMSFYEWEYSFNNYFEESMTDTSSLALQYRSQQKTENQVFNEQLNYYQQEDNLSLSELTLASSSFSHIFNPDFGLYTQNLLSFSETRESVSNTDKQNWAISGSSHYIFDTEYNDLTRVVHWNLNYSLVGELENTSSNQVFSRLQFVWPSKPDLVIDSTVQYSLQNDYEKIDLQNSISKTFPLMQRNNFTYSRNAYASYTESYSKTLTTKFSANYGHNLNISDTLSHFDRSSTSFSQSIGLNQNIQTKKQTTFVNTSIGSSAQVEAWEGSLWFADSRYYGIQSDAPTSTQSIQFSTRKNLIENNFVNSAMTLTASWNQEIYTAFEDTYFRTDLNHSYSHSKLKGIKNLSVSAENGAFYDGSNFSFSTTESAYYRIGATIFRSEINLKYSDEYSFLFRLDITRQL